jgi:hypothetical protein
MGHSCSDSIARTMKDQLQVRFVTVPNISEKKSEWLAMRINSQHAAVTESTAQIEVFANRCFRAVAAAPG